ncbi:hypothetical protein B0H10DRAFT_2212204 [Mycena sp. CBHHK59/15]|nr:hypothetical protein B0H10DRAFT_2212204 [Mycena sp. CBHHK59/15]
MCWKKFETKPPLFRRMASLHFCSECNNLLYPKADQQRRIMVYACRICTYDELVENKCVYRNDLLTVTKEQVGVTTDLGTDPTLASSCWINLIWRLIVTPGTL